MGYFPNGTEGADYEEQYCTKCVHDLNNDCPVWALHLLYNYDQFKDTPEQAQMSDVLTMLIPRAVKGDLHYNAQCTMFVPVSSLKEKPTPQSTISPEQARTFWVAP